MAFFKGMLYNNFTNTFNDSDKQTALQFQVEVRILA